MLQSRVTQKFFGLPIQWIIEYGTYTTIWLIMLLLPLLVASTAGVQLMPLGLIYAHTAPVGLAVLANHFILMPRLLFKGNWLGYGYSIFGLISLVLLAKYGIHHLWVHFHPDYAIPIPLVLIAIVNFLGTLLILGFDNAVKMTGKWLNEAHQHEMAAKENLETKIAALRHQISPHFFMNTLNNIHALVDVDPENAKESCIRLSCLMRYLLYDSETGNTTLAKEVEFIRSFFELMRLRYDSRVQIDFDAPDPVPALSLPSLLFIAFIENAFKHGIRPRSGSYVRVQISIINSLLSFSCVNSRFAKTENAALEKSTGIGLSNVKYRLDLLYPETHLLQIDESSYEYSVRLEIPV